MGSVLRVFVLVTVVAGVAALMQPDVARRILTETGPGMAANACRVPITYHLGDIDEGFVLDRSRVTAALDDAVAMWQGATEDELFHRRPGEGMPISLVFDERQRRAQTRRQTESDLAKSKDELEAEQSELERAHAELKRDWEALEKRHQTYEQRRAEHQERVRAWNNGELERTAQRKAELNDTAAQLEEEAEALQQRREALEERREDLRLKQETLQRQSDVYNEQVDEYNERTADVTGFQMGEYKQEGTDRRIHVYKAVDEAELRLVLAHELGHALGIKHVEPDGAVMNADLGRANRGRETLSAADRQALAEACDITVSEP
jgi:hypothetical protein